MHRTTRPSTALPHGRHFPLQMIWNSSCSCGDALIPPIVSLWCFAPLAPPLQPLRLRPLLPSSSLSSEMENRLAAEQNVHDDAEAPDVALDPVPAALPPIRANHPGAMYFSDPQMRWNGMARSTALPSRHPPSPSRKLAGTRALIPKSASHGRRSKALPRRVEKDIFWLEVSMGVSFAVHVGHRAVD